MGVLPLLVLLTGVLAAAKGDPCEEPKCKASDILFCAWFAWLVNIRSFLAGTYIKLNKKEVKLMF